MTKTEGNATTIERDGLGRPTAIIGPYGHRTVLAVDANGYLSSIADPAGNRSSTGAGSISHTYNPEFRPLSQSVNGGSTVTFGYDQDGA